MAEPPHPVLARRQGAPCRRSGRRGDRRDQQPGPDAAETDRRSTTRTCPPSPTMAAALAPGAPQVHDGVAGNLCYDWHIGDKAAIDAAFAKAAQGRRARPDQQPAGAERDGAARRDRRLRPHHRRLHALHHQPEPARHPAADGRLRAAHPRDTSCASWRPMSAAASAPRSTTTPRRRSSPGPPAKLAAPVKWTADRTEGFMSDAHGRDHVSHARAGARRRRQVPRRCASRPWPTWAPICPPSRRASRPTSTRRCWPASTRRRRSTAR